MDILLLGGDERMLYAGKKLREQGFTVAAAGFENAALPEGIKRYAPDSPPPGAVLTGVPLTKDGKTLFAPYAAKAIPLEAIPGYKAARLFAAGAIPGIDAVDYFADETLLRRNAALTAEGLLALLIAETPGALAGAKVVVTGFGRVGRAAAGLIKAAGGLPTAFVRRIDARDGALELGFDARLLEEFSEAAAGFDALINTVPAPVVGEKELAALRPDCVLFEAASAPFGIDRAAAERLGRKVIPAGGLPGRFSPKAAGEALADAVLALLGGGDSHE